MLSVVPGNTADTGWKVVEWSEAELTNNAGSIALDASSAVVIRSTHEKAAIKAISFSVTDDDGYTMVYWSGAGIKSTTMWDFASLTL